MKIALVGPTYPFRGGISHYTTLLHAHLNKKHRTEFYTFSRPYPKLLFPGDASHDSSRMQLSDTEAIPIVDWANPFSWFKTGFLIARWLPDVVIFPWWMWGWAIPFWVIGRIVSLRENTKILFICHNVIEHETAFWKRVLSKLALSVGDNFIVHSQEDYENLKRIFPDAEVALNVHPTYEVFKQSDMTKENAREILRIGTKFKKTLLFFGIIRSYKGLTYLIDAMPIIISKIPDICLLVVGEFWENKQEYLQRINELQIDGNVKVIDEYVPNEDVAVYFSAADVVVLPYASGTGSGIVQIAFGFHKPVIATAVGGLPDVVVDGKTGYLVKPRNSEEIADAVISFYRYKMEPKMIRNIMLNKDKFSWSRMVSTIESVAKKP